MSASASAFRFSLNPTIELDGTRFVATTSPLVQMMTFGAYFRRCVIDSSRRAIWLERRIFWFVTRVREISFDTVKHIDLEADEVGGGMGQLSDEDEVTLDGGGDFTRATTLWLVLEGRREERVRLLELYGSGGVSIEGGAAGREDEECGDLASRIAELIGIPVGRPLPHLADESGVRWRCRGCLRPTPPRHQRCLYCGGGVEPADAESEGPS